MSDQKLRDLERRWRQTGSVEDEAAYLLERVRTGELAQERLELAAYCGQQGATRALPARHPITKLRELIVVFEGLGEEARVQVAHAVGSAVLPLCPEEESTGPFAQSALGHSLDSLISAENCSPETRQRALATTQDSMWQALNWSLLEDQTTVTALIHGLLSWVGNPAIRSWVEPLERAVGRLPTLEAAAKARLAAWAIEPVRVTGP